MNEQRAAHLRDLAADAVPATVDLWPTIRDRLPATNSAARARRATPRRRLVALAGALILLVAVTLSAATPVATNAKAEVLALFGFRPLAVSTNAPICGSGTAQVVPIVSTIEAITVPAPASLPPDAVPGQRVICPAGQEAQPPDTVAP